MTSMVSGFVVQLSAPAIFEREILKGNRSSFIVCPVTLRFKLSAYTKILQTTGLNWHSGHICAEH